MPRDEAEAPLYRVKVGFLRGDEMLSQPVVAVAEGQWATVSISNGPLVEPDRRYAVWEETDSGPRVAVREEYNSGTFLAVRCERGAGRTVDLHLRTWQIAEGGSVTEKEIHGFVDPDVEHTFPADR